MSGLLGSQNLYSLLSLPISKLRSGMGILSEVAALCGFSAFLGAA